MVLSDVSSDLLGHTSGRCKGKNMFVEQLRDCCGRLKRDIFKDSRWMSRSFNRLPQLYTLRSDDTTCSLLLDLDGLEIGCRD